MSSRGVMPLELIVLVFVLVAFVAIVARFLPRDAAGRRRLPRIVDESVGMYIVRRSLGRPTEAASDLAKVGVDATAEVPEDEIAYRIGVPGAPEPTVPTRFVVSQAQPQAHPIPPVVPITDAAGRRRQAPGSPTWRGARAVPAANRGARDARGDPAGRVRGGLGAAGPRGGGALGDGDAGRHASLERARVRADAAADRGAARERADDRRPRPRQRAPPTASPSAATPPPAVATQAVTPTRTPRPDAPADPAPTPRRRRHPRRRRLLRRPRRPRPLRRRSSPRRHRHEPVARMRRRRRLT